MLLAVLLAAALGVAALARSHRGIRFHLDGARAALAGSLLLGSLLGARTGAAHRAACTAELRTGDPVEVRGTVAARPGPAGRSRLRLRLRDVSLRSNGRTCRVGAVSTRAVTAAAAPEIGARVRVSGEWTRFDAEPAWPVAPGRRGLVTGGLRRADAGPARSPLLALKASVGSRLARRLPGDVAPTALALLLAERDEIDADLRRQFVEAGLAHLLAISGMHVGLLAAGAVALFGPIVGARRRTPAALALVTAYVAMIGAPAAARRALVVFGAYTWARWRGWPTRAGELLGAALLCAIVAAPASLLEPGLQLSFAGFAGVVFGGRIASGLPAGRGRGRRAKLVRAAAAGGGAVVATAPVTALHFGQTTPVSLLSHFAGGPLVGIGLGSLVATVVLPAAVAGPAADLATGTLRALHAVADLFARVPGGHRAVAAPSVAVWMAWLLALEAARRVIARGRLAVAAGPVVLAGAALVAGPSLAGVTGGPALLCTLSVGQGDAAVLRTSNGRWLVFDGGPAWGDWNAGRRIVHPFLRRHGARRIDLAVLSHAHLDHLGGLHGLVLAMPVLHVLDSGWPEPSTGYASFLADVDAMGVGWLPGAAGDRLRIDDAEITVLGPVPRAAGGLAAAGDGEPAGANAASLSFRLTVAGRFRYLNTGDATHEEEAELLAAWPADSLRADLLKVGHHGSRTSSGSEFLRAVAPEVAVVSAGAGNRYGHPHEGVLRRLVTEGIERVWRTDRHGTLCVEIDRQGRWRVRGERTWRDPRA